MRLLNIEIDLLDLAAKTSPGPALPPPPSIEGPIGNLLDLGVLTG